MVPIAEGRRASLARTEALVFPRPGSAASALTAAVC